MKRFGLSALAALTLVAATPVAQSTDAEHYLDQFIDKTANPRNDFWQYSVGKWLKEHPIPKSERSWGVGNVIQEETYQRLSDISKNAAATTSARGSSAQRIGDFWFAAMDTAHTAQLGMAPLASEFARIAAIKNLSDVSAVVAHDQYIGASPLYGLALYQDEKHSDRYAVHLFQGGLGLPDRDYYTDTDDHAKMLQREYVAHVGRMFRLIGDDSAKAAANANTVMTIETELARASRKLEDLRDPIKNYNAMAIAGVDKNGTGRICVSLSNGLVTNNRPGGQYFYNLVDDNSSVR